MILALSVALAPALNSPRASTLTPDSVRALIASNRLADADSAAHALLARMEHEEGPESVATAGALDLLVEAMQAWPEALPFAERAVRIREAHPGLDDAGAAASWMNLGRVRIRMHRYHEAREPLEKALRARERAAGPDDLFLARILNNLALATEQDGDDAAAKALYERAIGIRERKLPSNDLATATVYLSLGRTCADMDDFEAGEAAFRRAIEIRSHADPPHPAAIATVLVQLGILQQRKGDLVSARASIERALPGLEAAGGDSSDLANGIDCLGTIDRDTGDYAGAKEAFTRTLRIRERYLGTDHRDVAISLDALGTLEDQLGHHQEARPLLERALAIRRQSLDANHVNLAISILNVASLLGELGESGRADSLCVEGIAILRRNYGESHQLVADGLTRRAVLRMRTGDAGDARELYGQALAIQNRVLGPDHPDAAATGVGLAAAEWRLGRPVEALGFTLRSEAAAREQLRLTERVLSEREATRYAVTRTNGLGIACSIARTGLADSLNREVWDALIRARASVLDEMAWRHRAIAQVGDSAAAGLSGRLATSGSRLSMLMVRGPRAGDSEGYRREVAAAREDLESAERALAERSGSYRALRAAEAVGLAEVRGRLPADAALVALARYARSDPGRPWDATTQEYIAFVLVGDRVSVVPLGSASEIEPLVSRFLADAGPSWIVAGRTPARAERRCRSDGESLRRRVWDPLAAAIGAARTVLLVPDGALSLIPFAALPTGSSSYLVETGPTIHYLSAERDVATSGNGARRNDGLLAIGGPDFDARGQFASLRGRGVPDSRTATGPLPSAAEYRGAHASCLEFHSVRFAGLPGAGREIRDISSLWRGRGLPLSGVLTGAAADEATFKRRAGRAAVLHVATHGFFLNADCAPGGGSGRGLGGIAAQSEPRPIRSKPTVHAPPSPSEPRENPLLLSGLAFAGANHRDSAGGDEEDGILTAEEIATLDLSGVRWAVLSACDTGQGEVAAGEGVIGLRRAFQIAGAGSLIMSLWAVDDRAALLWMKSLYRERLERKRSTAEAVRHACLDVLRGRRAAGLSTHPFYWSGFVAAGDWR